MLINIKIVNRFLAKFKNKIKCLEKSYLNESNYF